MLLVAYLPVLQSSEPIWDDMRFLFESERFTFVTSPLEFFGMGENKYLQRAWPLTYSLLWSVYKLVQSDYLIYKLVNLSLHFTNAMLLLKLTGSLHRLGALAVTLLFALHPMQVESVCWILQLGTLAATTFLILTFMVFQRLRTSNFPIGWPFFAGILLFLFSLLFKVVGILFPIFVVLYVIVHQRDLIRNRNFLLWTSLLLVCSFWRGVVTMRGVSTVGAEQELSQLYFKEKLAVGDLMTTIIARGNIQGLSDSTADITARGNIQGLSESTAEIIAQDNIQGPSESPSEIIEETTKKDEDSWVDQLFKRYPVLKTVTGKYNLLSGSLLSYLAIFFGFKDTLFFYPKDDFFDPLFRLVSSLCLVAVLVMLVMASWRRKLSGPGLLALTLYLPVSGLFYIPYMKYSYIADHWAYASSFFFSLMIFELASRRQLLARPLFLLPLGLLALKLCDQTRGYVPHFTTQHKILTYVSERNPKLGFIQLLLAEDHIKHNRPQLALDVLLAIKTPWGLDSENLKLFLFQKLDRHSEAADLLVVLIRQCLHEGRQDLLGMYMKLLLTRYPNHPQVQEIIQDTYHLVPQSTR
jgi:hypothetical protein